MEWNMYKYEKSKHAVKSSQVHQNQLHALSLT